MKIIFMGSAAFAVPSLRYLVKSQHDIVAVITQPDKPAGRGRKITPCAVAKEASDLGLNLYQPKSVKSQKVLDKISSFGADLIAVVAYGKLLPNKLLDMPKHGCINLHSSLLPKYRGAAPINWAIVNDEKESGITTMFISEELDAGDMLMKSAIKIEDSDTAITLHDKLATPGAELLLDTINRLKDGTLSPEPQNDKEVTFAPIIKKEDGLIDWAKDAKTIRNLVRGMQPWPIAYTHLDGKLLRIFDVSLFETELNGKPGEILEKTDRLLVATGSGALLIHELQIEGKKRMMSHDFINGHKINEKTILE